MNRLSQKAIELLALIDDDDDKEDDNDDDVVLDPMQISYNIQ
jgi:hypothetical protein